MRPASESPWIDAARAYVPRKPDPRITWFLDANEGRPLPSVVAAISAALSGPSGGVSRYPSFYELEAAIAEKWNVDPARIVVTGGGDDAIGRICMTRLAPGSKILVHEPAFEMFGVHARVRGAVVMGIPWLDGTPFPLGATVDAIQRDTSLGIATAVSPCNPTGGAVTREEALALADACAESGCAFLFDAAYGEFADDDPTPVLAADGSTYIVRSFSKAYGLAGLRLGYAIAPDAGRAGALRSCGMPYPSSSLAAIAAMAALADTEGVAAAIATVRKERAVLAEKLRSLGAKAADPKANFVLARVRDPAALAESMEASGVAIRSYGGKALLENAVRISCPCDVAGLAVVLEALDRAKEYIA
jgi:histidinol-phosphate aminotransferase